MAQLTITIPDADAARVLRRFCDAGGWVDVATSGTRVAFAKQMIINYVRTTVDKGERSEAEATAIASVVIPETIVT